MLSYTKDDATGELHEGLLGCFRDCGGCLMSCFCLPCANAKAWSMARGESCGMCHACVFPSAIWTRANIRRARGIDGPGLCSSSIAYCVMPCCFTAQNIRELKLLSKGSEPCRSDEEEGSA